MRTEEISVSWMKKRPSVTILWCLVIQLYLHYLRQYTSKRSRHLLAPLPEWPDKTRTLAACLSSHQWTAQVSLRVCSRHFLGADPHNGPVMNVGKRFASPRKKHIPRAKCAKAREAKRQVAILKSPSPASSHYALSFSLEDSNNNRLHVVAPSDHSHYHPQVEKKKIGYSELHTKRTPRSCCK